jgi:hypothetical protein
MTRRTTQTAQQTNAALLDEMTRLNDAIAHGIQVFFHGKTTEKRILGVETGGWYVCQQADGQVVKHKGNITTDWPEILQQAQLARHPFFRH